LFLLLQEFVNLDCLQADWSCSLNNG